MIATAENNSVSKLLLSLPEAAEALSVCERTISRLISRGKLHPIKVGQRGVRVAVSDLQAWIAKQQGGQQ
jgi:excisionase family DNA binding protein